jgi:hypothetical protein
MNCTHYVNNHPPFLTPLCPSDRFFYVRVVSSVRSQQSAQWILSSPLSKMETVECSWVTWPWLQSVSLSRSHSTATTTAQLILNIFLNDSDAQLRGQV